MKYNPGDELAIVAAFAAAGLWVLTAYFAEGRRSKVVARTVAVVVVAWAIVAAIGLLFYEDADAHPGRHPAPNWHRWESVASCESGQRWTYGPANHGRKPWSGFYGGLQFSGSTWRTVNATARPANRYATADQAPKRVQIAMADRLRRWHGIGHWPHCGARF